MFNVICNQNKIFCVAFNVLLYTKAQAQLYFFLIDGFPVQLVIEKFPAQILIKCIILLRNYIQFGRKKNVK
jgi:hypothetical protein